MIAWVGRRFKGNAEAVYNEIQELGESYTPDEIVEKAKDPTTELHKCFDWDDTIAAANWRRHTARLICCSLQVVVEKSGQEPITYRLIQNNKTEQAYKPITFTVRNDSEYSRLLKQAKQELKAFKERYAKIAELESVIDEIDRIINK